MFNSALRYCRVSLLTAAALPFAAGLSMLHAAAPVESSLENILRAAPSDSTVTVLVSPSSAFDLINLENQLLRSKAPRKQRHQRVVEALKLETARSQAGLLEFLNTERSRGRVQSYRAYWIANVVAVTTSAGRVEALAAHSDVGLVLENRKITLSDEKKKDSSGKLSSVESGATLAQTTKIFNWALEKINVRPLWQRGITGRGILVGNIDSGVDGAHPALASKWRGAHGATATESWYDAINGQPEPYDDYIGTHGTKTMSMMLGQSGADTIGVAPDAQWIAAKAFSMSTGDAATVLLCMEWMADPDGDPATVDDVPDILNLSFGDKAASGECIKTYWDAIENLKMLGVTPIIASGNRPGHGTKVSAPANSAKFFAVTAVDSLWQYVSHSMPGPSYCDPNVIKPDIVAPGHLVVVAKGTMYSSDFYTEDSGSSFACPLVSGVAALVRQANPELTPDQVYGVLRLSAVDLGAVGPDTLFGYGAVDADSAVIIAGRPTRPWLAITGIEIQAGDDDLISPGEDVGVVLTMVNNGLSAGSVSATVTSNSIDVTVTGGTASFGSVAAGATARNNSTPFAMNFSQSIPEAEIRTFNVNLTTGSYTQTLAFAVGVGGEPVPVVESFATHDINRAGLSITNYGTIGVDDLNGGGFIYPRTSALKPDQLFQGGLMIGNGPGRISDNSYRDDGATEFNREFAGLTGGNLEVWQPGIVADQEITGIFADSRATDPLNVTVHQRSYGWDSFESTDFIIVEYELSGPTDSVLQGLYVAQHIDWDVNGNDDSDNDLAAFEHGGKMAYMFDELANTYVGSVLLTQGVGGARLLNLNNDIKNGFNGQEKWAAMTASPWTDTVTTVQGDYSEIISAGPIYLKPDNPVSVAFAVIGGGSLEELRDHAASARFRWTQVAAEKGIDIATPSVTVNPLRNQAPEMLNYGMNVNALDSAGTVEKVSVIWREIAPQATAWVTTDATALFGGSFSVNLPGRTEGTRVQYFVRAVDAQGNQGLMPSGAPDELYTFYVGDTTRPVISDASSRSLGATGVEVSAKVTDLDLDAVRLILIADSPELDTLQMVPASAGSNNYSVVVGGLEAGKEYFYFVEATDTLGNYMRFPEAAPGDLLELSFSPVLAGDGDLNGKVDIFDLLAMLKVITGKKVPSAGEVAAMDLDINDKVNIFDLIELLKLLKN